MLCWPPQAMRTWHTATEHLTAISDRCTFSCYMQNRADNSESKTQSGPAHPYVLMPRCIETASAVCDLGGARTEIRKSVLAHHLKVDEGSAAFKQLIGSVKSFDLI